MKKEKNYHVRVSTMEIFLVSQTRYHSSSSSSFSFSRTASHISRSLFSFILKHNLIRMSLWKIPFSARNMYINSAMAKAKSGLLYLREFWHFRENGIWRRFFFAALVTINTLRALLLLMLSFVFCFRIDKRLDIPTVFNLLCACFLPLLRIKPWSQFLEATHTNQPEKKTTSNSMAKYEEYHTILKICNLYFDYYQAASKCMFLTVCSRCGIVHTHTHKQTRTRQGISNVIVIRRQSKIMY